MPGAAFFTEIRPFRQKDRKKRGKTLFFGKNVLAICQALCYYSKRTFFEKGVNNTYESKIFGKAHLRKMQNHQKKRGNHDHL